MNCLPYRACLLLLLTVACFAGCKKKPSAPAAASPTAPVAIAAPAPAEVHPPAFYAQLSDEDLVRMNQREGLGLGLKITGTTVSATDPIRFHLLIEDLSARVPVASGLCSGLSLSMENLTTQETLGSEIENRPCIGAVPDPDENPLTRGKLKTFNFTQLDAPNLTIPAGTYLVHLTWTAYPAGRPTLTDRQPYATIESNPVQITVVP